jgi:5-methylcytosine-specific restriction endonuclease McrA
MPLKFPRVCLGCGVVQRDGNRCAQCQDKAEVKRHAARPVQAYRNAAWRKLSKEMRTAHPWCEMCGITGEYQRLDVDHIVPLRPGEDPVRPKHELRVLCAPCHARVTASHQVRNG